MRNEVYENGMTSVRPFIGSIRPPQRLSGEYKLQKNANQFCFCSRVVSIWNSLRDLMVDADTLSTFKSRLDKHWLDQDVLYNFHSELTGTGCASICM